MIIKKIKLNNFLSHSDTELSLEDNSKILLDGKSGSGKSSIVEALVWCLYGNGRADNRSLIKKGFKSASVVVSVVSGDGTSYNISRTITNTGKHDIALSKKDKSKKRFFPVKVTGIKNIQEYIEKQILHSSYLLFLNSIVHPQDGIDSFVRQSATKRKEILLEIVGASDYDVYHDKIKDMIKELSVISSYDSSSIETKSENILSNKKILKENTITDKQISDIKEYIESKSKTKEELLKTLTVKENSLSLISDCSNKIVLLQNQITALESKLVELEVKNKDIDISKINNRIKENNIKVIGIEKLIEEKNEWNVKILDIVSFLPVDKGYAGTIENINSQIVKLYKKEIDICETIGKPCSMVEKERDIRINELTTTLRITKSEFKEYEKQLNIYNSKIEKLGEQPIVNESTFKTIKAQILSDEKLCEQYSESNDSKKIDIANCNSDIKIKKSVLGEQLLLLETFNSKIIGIDSDRSSLQVITDDIKIHEKEFSDKTIELTGYNIMKDSVKKLEKELKDIKDKTKDSSDKIESLELLKDAFGNNGIKSIVIDYIIPRFEDKINEILNKMSDFRVQLDTQRKSLNGDSVKEGLFIDIINEKGESLDFDSYSGGEKMKINMSIFEALASLSEIDFRIFDETFFALDQESSDNFMQVVKGIQEDVSQFICISHMQNIKDFFHNRVVVSKTNGDSVIN